MKRARWAGCFLAGTMFIAAADGRLVAAHAERTRAPASTPLPSDPAFEQRLTVRVTGMALDQLLPLLSRELGVTLRPATADVGDLRVSVFVHDRPATRVLDALTAMLNLTPDGGFGWRKARREYELYESPSARVLAAARLRQEEEAVLKGFRAQVRGMGNDPRVRKLWEDAPPASQLQNTSQLVSRLQRATQLLASLRDDQLERLLFDGVLVIRQPEAGWSQQQTLAQLASDVVSYVTARPPSFPEQHAMHQGLDPARVAVAFEREWESPHLSIMAQLALGPGKGAARWRVFPPLSGTARPWEPEQGASQRPRGGANPAVAALKDGDRVITLRPRSWAMADVLAELSRRSGRALISDCYTQRPGWEKLAALPPLSLARLLERVGEEYQVRWEERAGILLMRSRRAEAQRRREVPQRLVMRWSQQMRRDRTISLETLAEMAQRSEVEMSDLVAHPELRSLVTDGFHHTHVWAFKEIWRLYGLLPPGQRLAVAGGGLRLFGHQMSPPQQRQFGRWLAFGGQCPDIPESAYPDAELALRVGSGHELEITWTAGGRTKTWRRWLALDRDWITGEPSVWGAGQTESLVGRPAPPLTVRALDGRQLALPPAAVARPFLLYFRDTWVVPYVGKAPDTRDLEILQKLLARRPELRDRIAVIVPREPVAELRDWAAKSGIGLPVYADETGAITRAYGAGALPRAVVIGPDLRVMVVRAGYDGLMDEDWARAQ